jgi:hypothetical protein
MFTCYFIVSGLWIYALLGSAILWWFGVLYVSFIGICCGTFIVSKIFYFLIADEFNGAKWLLLSGLAGGIGFRTHTITQLHFFLGRFVFSYVLHFLIFFLLYDSWTSNVILTHLIYFCSCDLFSSNFLLALCSRDSLFELRLLVFSSLNKKLILTGRLISCILIRWYSASDISMYCLCMYFFASRIGVTYSLIERQQ